MVFISPTNPSDHAVGPPYDVSLKEVSDVLGAAGEAAPWSLVHPAVVDPEAEGGPPMIVVWRMVSTAV